MKGGLVESGLLINAFRCKLQYVTFTKNINRDNSIIRVCQHSSKFFLYQFNLTIQVSFVGMM